MKQSWFRGAAVAVTSVALVLGPGAGVLADPGRDTTDDGPRAPGAAVGAGPTAAAAHVSTGPTTGVTWLPGSMARVLRSADASGRRYAAHAADLARTRRGDTVALAQAALTAARAAHEVGDAVDAATVQQLTDGVLRLSTLLDRAGFTGVSIPSVPDAVRVPDADVDPAPLRPAHDLALAASIDEVAAEVFRLSVDVEVAAREAEVGEPIGGPGDLRAPAGLAPVDPEATGGADGAARDGGTDDAGDGAAPDGGTDGSDDGAEDSGVPAVADGSGAGADPDGAGATGADPDGAGATGAGADAPGAEGSRDGRRTEPGGEGPGDAARDGEARAGRPGSPVGTQGPAAGAAGTDGAGAAAGDDDSVAAADGADGDAADETRGDGLEPSDAADGREPATDGQATDGQATDGQAAAGAAADASAEPATLDALPAELVEGLAALEEAVAAASALLDGDLLSGDVAFFTPERARELVAAQGLDAADVAAWSLWKNGHVPLDELCAVEFSPGALLRCDAAYALELLNVEYRAEFGEDISITDSYRSYEAQVSVKARKGWLAATPGRSNHGWGVAVDLAGMGGLGDFSSPRHRWMVEHGPAYGWHHPRGMRPGGSGPPEPWHFEYGSATKAGEVRADRGSAADAT